MYTMSLEEFQGTNSSAKAGTNSKYCRDNWLSERPSRQSDVHTFSGIGTIADFFVSVCGLTETELPKESVKTEY
jgi:hypothetical protein